MKTQLQPFGQRKPIIASLTLHAPNEKSISRNNASTSMTILQWTFIAALILIVTQQVSAQQMDRRTNTQTSDAPAPPIELKGIVASAEDGTALTGVNVYIKDTSIGTSTDEKGRFSLKHNFKEGDVIVFTFIGLETQYYTIPVSNETTINIEVKMPQTTLMTFGELSEEGLYSGRRAKSTFWSQVKGLFE